MARRDPLSNPAPLIRRVYSYVAYRLGSGADAEDVTSEVFERALRYRESYDPSRGEPVAWLLGIARHCVGDAIRNRVPVPDADPRDEASSEDVEAEALTRLTVGEALGLLDDRGRDLVALRYGADLTARQIGDVLGMSTNAVEVALHRTLAQLRPELEAAREKARPKMREAAPRTST